MSYDLDICQGPGLSNVIHRESIWNGQKFSTKKNSGFHFLPESPLLYMCFSWSAQQQQKTNPSNRDCGPKLGSCRRLCIPAWNPQKSPACLFRHVTCAGRPAPLVHAHFWGGTSCTAAWMPVMAIFSILACATWANKWSSNFGKWFFLLKRRLPFFSSFLLISGRSKPNCKSWGCLLRSSFDTPWGKKRKALLDHFKKAQAKDENCAFEDFGWRGPYKFTYIKHAS